MNWRRTSTSARVDDDADEVVVPREAPRAADPSAATAAGLGRDVHGHGVGDGQTRAAAEFLVAQKVRGQLAQALLLGGRQAPQKAARGHGGLPQRIGNGRRLARHRARAAAMP